MKIKYLIGLAGMFWLITRTSVVGYIPIQVVESDIPVQTINASINNSKIQIIDNDEIQIIEPIPISDYERPYEIEKIGYIWRAQNGSSYIDYDNDTVQWFIKYTEIIDGILYYRGTDNRVVPTYYPDFDYENSDYWINADYYLSHGLTGDCEDYAIAIASILEAKDIPNMIVGGFQNGINNKHWILEYYYNNEYYITDTSYGLYIKRSIIEELDWVPLLMFNKETDYKIYNKDWAAK